MANKLLILDTESKGNFKITFTLPSSEPEKEKSEIEILEEKIRFSEFFLNYGYVFDDLRPRHEKSLITNKRKLIILKIKNQKL